MVFIPATGARMALAACAAAVVLASCAPRAPRDAGAANDADLEAAEYHVRLPMERVEDVMAGKLAHAKALLEGLALEDFGQIEANAGDLSQLSEEAGWRVHATPAYGIHSDAFRVTTDAMAEHARQRDMAAVLDDYVRMTRSCIACHSYMRGEGLYHEVPGKVSLAVPSLLNVEERSEE
ncbi:MAG: hypothetical protein GY715_21890 [Planctomycetes bacterium]|nr:hypothetical protein [Planctomycetota bacterium]